MSARVQRLCRRDYNDYLNYICQYVEDHAQKYQTRDTFVKIKSLENYEGKLLLSEIDQIMKWWRSCSEQLYADATAGPDYTANTYEHTLEPDIMELKIRAINKLKTNKSAGRDKILAEELKNI